MSSEKKGRIYCVVRPELGSEVYESLVEYYRDDPDVEVIPERRKSERRAANSEAPTGEQRTVRDRRTHAVPRTLPKSLES